MTRFRIFLDDTREPPLGWTLFRSAEAMLAFIAWVGLDAVDEISFDNDLGTERMEGYQALDRIEVLIRDGASAPLLHIHSANTAARRRMEQAIAAIARFCAIAADGM